MSRSDVTARLGVVALVVVAGSIGVYLAARGGGAPAGALAAIATTCAVALVLNAPERRVSSPTAGGVFEGALLALPGALIVYFAFDSGGYFPASPAVAAIVLVVLLVLRTTLAGEPFAAFSGPLAIAAGALGLLAIWTVASSLWSDAAGRALVEYDRALAYLLLLVLIGSVARSSSRLRLLAVGILVAVVVVAVAALATRLYPDRFPVSIPTIGAASLTYPVTYANALGILCTLGGVLALFFATSLRQPVWARAAASATLPLLAVTIFFTQSRGALVAAVIGVVVYVVLGRPRGLLTGLVAAAPLSAAAVLAADSKELLRSQDPTSSAAAAQGHELALVLLLCVAGAAALRVLLAPVDTRLARFSLPDQQRRPILFAASATALLAVLAVGVAIGAPGRIADEYDRFVESADAGPLERPDESFFNVSNRGLLDNWRVGLDAFADAPFGGQGAGTYEVNWFERRPAEQAGNPVVDGHSLYVETLSELGMFGLVLLLAALGAMLVALAPLRRGPHRTLYAALFAFVVAWAAHAAIDWDWEMPVVTTGVIALGGAGLAAHHRNLARGATPQSVRVVVGLGLLLAAVGPGFVLASQGPLNEARDELRDGDCAAAIDRASASIEALAVRAEPYEILALCQARNGRTGLAIEAMRKAVERDPGYWRYHYGLAVLRGGAGLNARPALVEARRLNPHDPEIKALLADLRPGEAVDWDVDLAAPGGAVGAQP